jgi:katanin p60 ATPase-containing subunit A1
MSETESRMSEEKRILERKRNLIILIEKYLLTCGYLDAVTKIEQESNITLEKWDTADNVDLYMILIEYERAYQKHFDKFPKIVKKVDDRSTYDQLRKAAIKQKQINSTIKKEESQPQNGNSSSNPPQKRK